MGGMVQRWMILGNCRKNPAAAPALRRGVAECTHEAQPQDSGGDFSYHPLQDAAQATFLTLARKANSLSGHDSIAGWLHTVAWHISKRARAARELRLHRERNAAAEAVAQRTSADVADPAASVAASDDQKLVSS